MITFLLIKINLKQVALISHEKKTISGFDKIDKDFLTNFTVFFHIEIVCFHLFTSP